MSRWRGIATGLLILAGAAVPQACQKASTCSCESGTSIAVSATQGNLPETCVSKVAGTTLSWRASDGSQLTIKMPDWGTQQPTTPVNPYPGASCSGSSCTSGSFAGASIPDCTAIRYSITTTNGSQSTTHFGHIIINR